MKLKNGYDVYEAEGEYSLIPLLDQVGEYKEAVMGLTETEAFLCRMLLEERTHEELAKALLDEFDAEEETVREDVEEFTAFLKRKRMLNGYD